MRRRILLFTGGVVVNHTSAVQHMRISGDTPRSGDDERKYLRASPRWELLDK
jgi:hypothetical protein